MLTLHTPTLEELSFRQSLLSDEQTMSYNARWGGTISFSRDRWEGWYDRWVAHPQGKRFYAYLHSEKDGFVGETGCHLDEDGRWIVDIIVHSRFRSRGYGTQGLTLLCEQCRKMGCTVIYDDIAKDNPSLSLFLKQGFCAVETTDDTVIVRKYL